MNSIFTIILFSIIFLSFLLILVIMVQNPKGGGKVNGEKMYFEATETPNSVGEDLCELCGEKLTLKNELINHTEKAHAKKADNCSKCGKNNQSLKFPTSHIRTVHTVL